jgi:GxxExxY protein
LPRAFAREIRERTRKEIGMKEIVFKDESYKIIGACFEVYKQKGIGFTEPLYQECLQIELSLQGLPFVAQPELRLEYKGTTLLQFFKPDFICYGKIIVEIKALDKLVDAHRSQTINYLNETGFDLALLINFGHYPKLEYERIVNNSNRDRNTIYDEIATWSNPNI